MTEELLLEGSGGKGGGSGKGATEEPNSLRSSAVVHVVEVISEGEIVGICGGAQGVYINDTPLQASDASYNFPRASWSYRVGLPNQDYMTGFSAVESEVSISSPVTIATPVSRTTSAANVDAVKVTMQLPNGLYSQNTTTGDMSGTSVSFAIEKKLSSSGAWTDTKTFVIEGKTTSPYERQYRINRPTGSGTWDVRVVRVTVDSTSSALKNATTFARLTEVLDVKDTIVQYNDTAVIGIAIDAETVGNQIPNRSYLVKGIKCQIPSNYDPVARSYTGTWNGTFNVAWTDNPAWVLYDILTNDRYGLGEFISPAQVDKYSFYDAAVYNDGGWLGSSTGAWITGGVPNGSGGYEPRFTFNGIINTREDALRVLQTVAGAFRAQLIYVNGLVTVLQDRPSSPVKLITKANVIDGMFDYKSSGLFERHTAFNVTYNDKKDRHLQRIVTIDASTQTGAFQSQLVAAEAKYGYNPIDIAAFGCTNESQALRHGRWYADTELNQTEIASWKMSINGFDLMPGDIVKLYDEDYTMHVGGGRIVSVSGTTVNLDRAVPLTSGSTIEVLLADGITMETRNVVQTSGTLSTVTVNAAFSQSVLSGADYILKTTASPRQFKLMGIRQEEANIISVEAVFHDPSKYDRVETGVVVAGTLYSDATQLNCTAPTNLVFQDNITNIDGVIGRSLLISWGAPAIGAAAQYSIMWRYNSGTWNSVTQHGSLAYEIQNANLGVYDVRIYAISAYGNQSQPLSGTYTIGVGGGGTSPLLAPTNLVEYNGYGTNFFSPDLQFKFTNPAGQASITTATLKDFEVRIIEPSTLTTLRTWYVDPVIPGGIANSVYTYSMNQGDHSNVANRAVRIQVRCRDTKNNLSAPIEVTFTNAAPAVPSTITAVAGYENVVITTADSTTPIDFNGMIVWGSTVSGFTPSISNVVYKSPGKIANLSASGSTTMFYRVAWFDTFSDQNLAISAEMSATTTSPNNTNEYKLVGITWTPNSPAVNQVSWTGCTVYKTLGNPPMAPIAVSGGSATWTSGVLYIYYTEGATTLSSTSSITTAVSSTSMIVATYRGGTSLEHGDGMAYQDGSFILAGTIASSKIVAGDITATQINSVLLKSDNVLTRGLTVRDEAGNVILSSGVPLSVSNAASGLQNSNVLVGSTNLQRNSGQWSSTSTPWASNGSTVSMDTVINYGSYASMKLVGAGGATVNGGYVSRLKPNTQYTVSAMVRGSSALGSAYDNTLHIQNWRDEDTANVHQETSGAFDTAVNTGWRRIWQTFTTCSSTNLTYCRFYFYPLAAGFQLNVGYVQIEEGNTPTDWSACPDDVSSNIAVAATTANYSNLTGTPSTAIANSNITVSGGSIYGIGTGAGTQVANNSIYIAGGRIYNIGTGNASMVDNSLITIGSNGVLTNAGGGTVSLAGLGAGAFATLNAITAANASTYISGAIIGTANIQTAAITNAAIANLAVDTLNIKGTAVTAPYFNSTTAYDFTANYSIPDTNTAYYDCYILVTWQQSETGSINLSIDGSTVYSATGVGGSHMCVAYRTTSMSTNTNHTITFTRGTHVGISGVQMYIVAYKK